jgi:formate dehydrogenase major subunit
MGGKWEYPDAESIWEEIRKVAPIFAGASYRRLKQLPGILWPCYDESHPGTSRLFEDGFSFRDRRARFIPPGLPETLVEQTDDYPYVLITGRLLAHFNTGEMSRRSKKLLSAVSGSFLQMHPDDAEREEFSTGDWIRITSPYGAAPATLKVTEEVPAGYLFVPIHFEKPNVNALTSAVPLDPYARMPALKVIPASVERLSTPATPDKE